MHIASQQISCIPATLNVAQLRPGQEHISNHHVLVVQHKKTHLLVFTQAVAAHKLSHTLRGNNLKGTLRVPVGSKHLTAELIHLHRHIIPLRLRHCLHTRCLSQVVVVGNHVKLTVLAARRVNDDTLLHHVLTKSHLDTLQQFLVLSRRFQSSSRVVMHKIHLFRLQRLVGHQCLLVRCHHIHITTHAQVYHRRPSVLHQYKERVLHSSILQLPEDICNVLRTLHLLLTGEVKLLRLLIHSLHMTRLALLQFAQTQLRRIE